MKTWKPVLGFEGFYEASSDGEILSIKRQNHKDKRVHGTWQVGEKANNVKLTNKIVISIRTNKLTPKQAVEIYGLSLTNAKRIVNKETWKHLDV